MILFSDIHISQGSVATCLKRGGIFEHEFVANLLPSTLVKFFCKSWCGVMAKSLMSCFFDSRCNCIIKVSCFVLLNSGLPFSVAPLQPAPVCPTHRQITLHCDMCNSSSTSVLNHPVSTTVTLAYAPCGRLS